MTSAVYNPARKAAAYFWLSPSRGEGRCPGLGLPHCMLGLNSYPVKHPTPSPGALRGQETANRVGTVYSLMTLNKEGTLTRLLLFLCQLS